MVDVTKCVNIECEYKHRCYKYMVYPSKFSQSYSIFNGCRRPAPIGDWGAECLSNEAADKEAEDIFKRIRSMKNDD